MTYPPTGQPGCADLITGRRRWRRSNLPGVPARSARRVQLLYATGLTETAGLQAAPAELAGAVYARPGRANASRLRGPGVRVVGQFEPVRLGGHVESL